MNDKQTENLAVAFVGHSGSGKTTLVEKIIALLSAQGLRVGSIKHHGHLGIEVDREGKDSWRHMHAGSVHTIISSPDRLISIEIREKEQTLERILASMDCLDIIIVEGYRDSGIPYFELSRKDNLRDSDELPQEGHGKRIALVTDREPVKEKAAVQGVDYYDLDDPESICSRIELYISHKTL